MDCNINSLDKRLLRKLVERLIPFDDLIEVGYGNCFCPFHYNTKTPAAKFFHDEDGITRLQCWTCSRQYNSYDYIKLVMKQDPIKLINKDYTKKELNDIVKVLKDTGVFNLDIKDFSNEIHNKWVDSDENLTVFLDDIYKGHRLKDI